MNRHRWHFTLFVIFALLIASCGGTTAVQPTPAPPVAATPPPPLATPAPVETPGPIGDLRTPEEAARWAADGQQLGGMVSVLGTWGGSEQDSFLAMVQPFEQATGVRVEYEGTRDLNAVLTTRVQGGNPPDLAGLPGPGQMAEFARQGQLVDLGGVLDTNLYQDQYTQNWVDLGSVDNRQVGIFIKAAAKGLIWYNPQVWNQQNFQFPETWEQMTALSAQMITQAEGSPWCIGLESGAASGWPGTDWIEDIVLRQSGPDVYDRWYQGELAWTSPEITQAWNTWGQIVGNPEMVYGGAATMLTTNFGNAGDPLFTTPPGCYMHHQASFITDFYVQNNPNLQPLQDFDFFSFPGFEENQGEQLIVAGDLFGMFNDTPQARALMRYLTTPEAQAIWVQRGGAISPNRAVPLEAYPDELSRKSAELLTTAETLRFDASDLMPEAMNNAFWRAVLDFVQAPDNIESILQELDRVQTDAYQQP